MKKTGLSLILFVILGILMLTICGCDNETGDHEVLQDGYIEATFDKPYIFEDSAPVFSLDGTFYSQPIMVELKTEAESVIRYTLDGSDPNEQSMRYDPEEPIRFELSDPNFPEAYTVKARAYYPDGAVSAVSCRTYFCCANARERFTTTVFSISGDPSVLTDGPDGIFYGDNYNLRGDESEREVFIEAWDKNGSRIIAQYSGIRIFGGESRQNVMKSVKLYARKSYSSGIGKFKYDFFGTPVEDGSSKTIQKYDKLVLRNAGNDFQFAFIRDELAQTLAMQAGFDDYEAVIPAVVYLNGDYYGLFWLHENYCDDYFKEKYPNEDAQGEFVVIEGAERWKDTNEDGGKEVYAEEYVRLYKTYSKSDLTDPETYALLLQFMDVQNYLDYYAFNIYINNFDWPLNNYKCYRYVGAENEDFTGVYDGKWRFLLHDTDFSFSMYSRDDVSAAYNNLKDILDPKNSHYSPMFDALMHRSDCREYFLNKLRELSQGALSGTNVEQTLSYMNSLRSAEMDYFYKHIKNLQAQGEDSLWTNSYALKNNIREICEFANTRADYILAYAEDLLQQYGE